MIQLKTDSEHFRERPVESAEGIYVLLASLFIGTLLTTNIIICKYISLGPFVVTAAAISYPFTFLFMDIITECYGKRRAQIVILIGLLVSIFMAFMIHIAKHMPSHSASPVSEEAFNRVFGFTPGVVAASMVAYLIGQWADVYLFDWIKQLTKGKYLWLRNMGSTLIAQLLDTIIFATIAWIIWKKTGGSSAVSLASWCQITRHEYALKVVCTFLSIPLVYRAVSGVRWLEKYFASEASRAR
jgi:uncharacterized integral membrane protein (TIGR00697 family)